MHEIHYIIGERNKKPLELNGSVAIVGNSDLLTAASWGDQIDAHDHVFRFNLAVLSSRLQPSIGSKADFFLLSQNITTYKYPHNKELHLRFVKICKHSSVICYPGHTKNVRRFNKRPRVMTLEISDINKIIYQLLGHAELRFSLKNHPRNGVKLLLCLLHAGVKPRLFGFDMQDRGNNSHYFDDEVQEENPHGGHMPSLEFELLKQLTEANLIEFAG